MPESQVQVIPPILDPKPGERYSCPLCTFQTPSKKTLGVHTWGTHGQKAFPCPAEDCSYRAVRPDNLQTHIRSCTAGARQRRQKVSKPKEIERLGPLRKTRVSVRNLPPRIDLDSHPPPTGGPSGPTVSRASILPLLTTSSSWSPRPSAQAQAPAAVPRDIQVPQVTPQQVQPLNQQNQIQANAERPDNVMVDAPTPVSQSTLRERLDDAAHILRTEIKDLKEKYAKLIEENNALKEENVILVKKNEMLKEESGKLEETGKLKEQELKLESDVWRRQYMSIMMESTRR
ncbi:hypothetical protein TWF730_000195 [Orbilia blumenaviensis]|uniref:C2H2-type domain-containing protein n=1 Tax=Orbilia blumenaviensis TaxID=1796055 RepID=A0AAV9VKT3_9PEZI